MFNSEASDMLNHLTLSQLAPTQGRGVTSKEGFAVPKDFKFSMDIKAVSCLLTKLFFVGYTLMGKRSL